MNFPIMAESIDLGGWRLQDATVVRAEAVKGGWFRQDSSRQSEEGRTISRNDYRPDREWHAATVPGTVLTSLVDCGVYPEPTYGENNRPEVIPDDLCRRDWWYRTTVKVPESFRDRLVWLEFDGINYQAEIWVNGRKAGEMKGAFKRGNFDVTNYAVKPGKETTIAVLISPQPSVGVPNEHTLGTNGGPCGGMARLDGPTFSCSIGWDWLGGVRDRNSGIWRKVRLSATGPATLLDSQVETDLPQLPKRDLATVSATIPVRNATDKPVKGKLSFSFGDRQFSREVTLAPWGTAKENFAFTLENPKLWWPTDLGEPYLYDAAWKFEVEGKVSDARHEKIGVRRFDYFQPGSDKLKLYVNGVHVFMRGGNWGLDEMLKRIPRERLEAQVRMHRDAHFNMIRNWGGQSPSDELVSLCDQYGILFWDEFWHFSNLGPIDPNLYLANMRDHVLHFRNHASLVFWCGRNEATPPKYLDDEMRYLLLELDPKRHYQSNSGNGHGFNSGGPYDWVPPTRHSRYWEDSHVPRAETFKSEIGSFVIPTIESMQSMMPEKDWQGYTHAWGEHDFGSGGGRKIPRFMKARYGEPKNFADFCRKGQLMTYEVHRAMFEGRFGRMFAPAEGALLWMSIPAHPSLVWNMIAYDLEPHAAFFAVQEACKPVHVFFTETDRGTVFLVNHQPKTAKGQVWLVFRNFDGSVAGTQSFAAEVEGPAVQTLGKIGWPEKLSKVHFLEFAYEGIDGTRDDNFYWRNNAMLEVAAKDVHDDNKLVQLEDLKDLEHLPTVTLVAQAEVRNGKDGRSFVDVKLENPSSTVVALMAHLQLHAAKSGRRVLPAYYSENYVSLPPGATRTVTIECAAKALAGDSPVVLVDGWNVKVQETELVKNNRNADPADARWAHQRGMALKVPEAKPQEVVRINCGGYNRGGFAADPGFVEGACGFQSEDMDMTNGGNLGPADIYRTVRWSNSSYVCRMTKANAPYTVRLHFAEHSRDKGPGKDRFNVKANGKIILQDFDAAGAAGGVWKAVAVDVKNVMSDANGVIKLEFEGGPRTGDEQHRDPRVCGIEVF